VRLSALCLAVFIVVLGLQPSWISRWSELNTATLIIDPALQVEIPTADLAQQHKIPQLD
jgi:NAD(P)H-quinone oxidoreductase subunit 4